MLPSPKPREDPTTRRQPPTCGTDPTIALAIYKQLSLLIKIIHVVFHFVQLFIAMLISQVIFRPWYPNIFNIS